MRRRRKQSGTGETIRCEGEQSEAATQTTENHSKRDYKTSSRIKWPADPVRNVTVAHINIRPGMNDEVKTGLIIF